MQSCFLGVDIGTTAMKILVVGQDGNTIGLYREDTPKKIIEGITFLDLRRIYEYFLQIYSKIKNGYKILGVSCASISESVIPIRNAKALTDPLIWYEECTLSYKASFGEKAEALSGYNVSGFENEHIFSLYKILWTRDRIKPQTVDFWIPLSSYIPFMMTGKAVWDITQGCRSYMMNVHKRAWNKELADFFGLYGNLGVLKYTSSFIGYAEDGVPFFSSGHDHMTGLFGICRIIGTDRIIYDSMGTASSIAGLFKKNETDQDLEHPFMGKSGNIGAAFEDNQYYAENSIRFYGKFLEYLMKLVCMDIKPEDFKKINKEIESLSEVRESCIFLTGGDPVVGKKNNFFNIMDACDNLTAPLLIQSGYIYLSLISKKIAEAVNSFLPRDSYYYASGGNTDNKVLMQYKASLLNKDIITTDIREGTALGAVVSAITGSGCEKTLRCISDKVKKEVIKPDPKVAVQIKKAEERILRRYSEIISGNFF
ncbi:MAG TPA: FGGY family carbohydrate kinase [Petrotogaceae bacterium]|nr:FGGY family carbohydrate kinase [Petrotogaceae bacterium]